MAKKSVLVVDDDNSIRSLVAALLTREGYRVDTATGGREALSKLEKESFDAVVLDLMMPEVTGHDVLEKLKEERTSKCVVIMSAASDVQKVEPGIPVVAATVRKPFEIEDLLSAVKRCFPKAK